MPADQKYGRNDYFIFFALGSGGNGYLGAANRQKRKTDLLFHVEFLLYIRGIMVDTDGSCPAALLIALSIPNAKGLPRAAARIGFEIEVEKQFLTFEVITLLLPCLSPSG